MAEYYSRIIERMIEKKMQSSGAVLVNGPKFCGKTTTCLRYAKSSIRLNTRQTIKLAGMEPRNVFHECDHLDGKVYLRLVTDPPADRKKEA